MKPFYDCVPVKVEVSPDGTVRLKIEIGGGA
jgi:hypothetical protein